MELRLRLLYTILLSVGSFCIVQAQELLGNTGGFNIPTADMEPAGTFRGGINFIGNGIITSEKGADDHRWQFDYNTGSYFVNFTFFDWLEATFRETLLESDSYGKYNDYSHFREQDRSVTIKVRPLREGRYWPAVAIGINDPYSFTGHHVYSSVWLVMTKHEYLPILQGTLSATLGFAKAFDQSQMYNGLLAGIRYQPDIFPEGSAMIEYDSQGVNLGIQALLWKHLGAYLFTRNFSTLGAGIKYQTTLKFRKK